MLATLGVRLIRDAAGSNRDDLLGGADRDGAPIPPGGERRLRQVAVRFADAAGEYAFGIKYAAFNVSVVRPPD